MEAILLNVFRLASISGAMRSHMLLRDTIQLQWICRKANFGTEAIIGNC